jgi:hypothetical protein
MKTWQLPAAVCSLLVAAAVVARAAPPSGPIVTPLPVRAGAAINLASEGVPPRTKVVHHSLTSAAKLAAIKTNLHIDLKPENIDAPVHLDANAPFLESGRYALTASQVERWETGLMAADGTGGPSIGIFGLGAAGSYHPFFAASFVVHPDRGALVECALAAPDSGSWSVSIGTGESSPAQPLTSLPPVLTEVIPKASTERHGNLSIRVEGPGSWFVVTGCDITPIHY